MLKYINADNLQDLQSNLIRSHACGLGEDMHPEDVLAMMVIRANSLAKGHSGVRPLVIDRCWLVFILASPPKFLESGPLVHPRSGPTGSLAMGLMGEGDGYIRSTSAQHGERLSGWRKTQMSRSPRCQV